MVLISAVLSESILLCPINGGSQRRFGSHRFEFSESLNALLKCDAPRLAEQKVAELPLIGELGMHVCGLRQAADSGPKFRGSAALWGGIHLPGGVEDCINMLGCGDAALTNAEQVVHQIIRDLVISLQSEDVAEFVHHRCQ